MSIKDVSVKGDDRGNYKLVGGTEEERRYVAAATFKGFKDKIHSKNGPVMLFNYTFTDEELTEILSKEMS
jgi:hypothetical protein